MLLSIFATAEILNDGTRDYHIYVVYFVDCRICHWHLPVVVNLQMRKKLSGRF